MQNTRSTLLRNKSNFVAIFWDIATCRTDVSKRNIASIFRAENQPSKKPVCSRWIWFIYRLDAAIFLKMATFITTAVRT
jgi:hypothetical protein